MSIFRSFNISMIPGKPPLIIHVSQYESDFVYTFHLVSGKSVLAIPETAIAVIRGTKRDGNGYSVEAALDAENHKVVVMGDPQLTACAGRNVFELAIINNDKTICTANFFLDVERAPLDSDTIRSETVLHDLQAIINSAATATQAAEEASASAQAAASSAADAAESARASSLTDGVKDALLACFRSVAWTTEDGQQLYQALYDALYSDERIISISAVFTQGTAKIYTTDSLDVLKQYLTVTVTYYGGTESVITDYVLSGALEEGTSTITAIYGGKTATFNVTVTGEQTNLLYSWDFTKSLTDSVTGKTATTTATRDSNGLSFNGYGQYIDYDLSFSRDKTFEIDIDYIGTKVEGTTGHDTAYRRLLAFGENGTLTESNTAAFLCSTQSGRPGWWWYLGSVWDADAISQSLKDVSKYSYFDGKTIKVYVDASGKCYVYEKTIGASDAAYTLAGQSTNTLKAFTSAKVYMGGSGNDALADARIKAFRIYEGEK